MKLTNDTPFPAMLISAPMDGTDDVHAFAIAKQTYDLEPTGKLTLAQDRVPINPEPIATPFGTFHGEIFPRKDRADFAVLGTVRLPSAREQTVVTAHLGRFTSRLRIVGDRFWRSVGRGEPVPSAPQRFVEMPIAYSRAFGGKSPGPMGDVAWPDNPEGIGFYQTESEAIGKRLPNIEWASAPPLRSWQDRPEPAGWGPYPMFWGLRAVQSVLLDDQKNVAGISRKAFNHAHPALVVDSIAEGDQVVIEGLSSVPLAFEVPRTSSMLAWQAGTEQGQVPLAIDGLFVWTDQRKVVITRRARFRYSYRPGEARTATLSEVGA